MTLKLADKIALVTGATSGIGLEIARSNLLSLLLLLLLLLLLPCP